MLESVSLCSTYQSHASREREIVHACVCVWVCVGSMDRACKSWVRAEISHKVYLSLKWTCVHTQKYIPHCWLVKFLLTYAHVQCILAWSLLRDKNKSINVKSLQLWTMAFLFRGCDTGRRCLQTLVKSTALSFVWWEMWCWPEKMSPVHVTF